MKHAPRNEKRDAVLFAFHEAYDCPTVEQIIEWTTRYPEFAEDIRSHAAIAHDWAAHESDDLPELQGDLVARAYSNALNLIYKADREGAAPVAARSFQDILAGADITIPALARKMNIKRVVVNDLVAGGMDGPFADIFVTTLTEIVAISDDEFHVAHRHAREHPVVGLAKADGPPTALVRTYEQIVRSSGMTDDEIRYWLQGI